MGKKEQTIYTCDRCGVKISADVRSQFLLRKYKYVYEFMSYLPTEEFPEIMYLCSKCRKELKMFMKGGEVNG